MVYYLETKSTDPYYNLAFEEYVLTHRTEGDYLLLWQHDNTIVVGQNQNTEAEINRAFVEEHHINVVRRGTGGRLGLDACLARASAIRSSSGALQLGGVGRRHRRAQCAVLACRLRGPHGGRREELCSTAEEGIFLLAVLGRQAQVLGQPDGAHGER